jgi:carboxypeptidase PM20D1
VAGSSNETQAPSHLANADIAPPSQAADAPMSVGVTRAAIAAVVALGLALLWLVWRAAGRSPRRLHVAPLDTAPVDAERVAHALAQTIRHETITLSREAPLPAEAFEALQAELGDLFPRVHASLELERVGEWSLLYTWRGREPELAPVILVAHQDVVPVDPGTEDAWSQPPFSGALSGGEVWGRGALDDKGSLVAILAAVEDLLAERFAPRRTLLLAIGHDEEIGGEAGARAIAEELASRGVRAELVLDEGGIVSDGVLPGLGPVALVGVAEKGAVSLELVAEAPGGHSSMPPPQSAIGVLAEAVRRLETRRPSARLVEPTRATLAAIAPELPFLRRLVLANADVLGPLVLRVLATRPALDAAIRTTTATTLISGGAKSNVLPERASAVVNFRILPGETVDDVMAHARATVDDPRLRIAIEPGTSGREPTAVSPTDGPAFALLEETILARFPGVIVAPYLVLGRTDARHFEAISKNVYRFLPLRLHAADARTRLHGTDERVGVEELAGAVGFYRELIRRAQRDG